MDLNTQLKKYAQLIAKVGLNVQEGQPVLVRASTETREFVAKVVEACYELGAKRVSVEWRDQELTKLHLNYQHLMLFDDSIGFHSDPFPISHRKYLISIR